MEISNNPKVDPRAVMAAGSKSFSFAAAFFSQEQREGAALLYRWCRYCDDQVDQCLTEAEKLKTVELLRVKTLLAFDPESRLLEDPPFAALQLVARKFSIPKQYALDLLQGFQLDAENRRYETWEDLDRYGYHVAGTVGLMMCYVMGVTSPQALQHAIHLGIAMQLTNIARDVSEDFEMGRVYLPQEELRKSNLVREEELSSQEGQAKAWPIVLALLSRADQHYSLGIEGIQYLPWRAAITIRVAAYIYRRIGGVILRQTKTSRFRVRAITSFSEKCWATVQALWHQGLGHSPIGSEEMRPMALDHWQKTGP
jgi:15-cis-phytoene synthase